MKNLEDSHSKCSVINNESTLNLASSAAGKSIFGQSGGVLFSSMSMLENLKQPA